MYVPFKLYDGAEVGPLLEAALEGTEPPVEARMAEGGEGADAGAGDNMEVDT